MGRGPTSEATASYVTVYTAVVCGSRQCHSRGPILPRRRPRLGAARVLRLLGGEQHVQMPATSGAPKGNGKTGEDGSPYVELM